VFEAPPTDTPVPSRPFEFSLPGERRVAAHADKLRANPGDAALRGYPDDLVRRSAAEAALAPGSKPAVILFFDDTARASHLQAAELLPLLARWQEQDKLEILPIDVRASARWTPAERKLVRTYYMSYVPTTVVLSPERKALLLQYQRVSAAVVEAALTSTPR
jgi:hypothetical protein